jgi:hypothetical protein
MSPTRMLATDMGGTFIGDDPKMRRLQEDLDDSEIFEHATVEVARSAMAEVRPRQETRRMAFARERSGRNLVRCQIGENKRPYRARHVSQGRWNDELI